jgi:hypothetical protein
MIRKSARRAPEPLPNRAADLESQVTDESSESTAAAAAWGAASAGEPRWPAAIAVVIAIALYVTLPNKLTYGPKWLLPGLECALLIPLLVNSPRRHPEESMWTRILSLGLIAIITLFNIVSLILLINFLINGTQQSGRDLVFFSMQIWFTNVLAFGLWYWEFDRGGPGRRCHVLHRKPDFLFPQMANPDAAPKDWCPSFIDYMYVSFTNATAFSPTDTMPLTQWAKLLMAVQSLASLLTVALVAARAVNILR